MTVKNVPAIIIIGVFISVISSLISHAILERYGKPVRTDKE